MAFLRPGHRQRLPDQLLSGGLELRYQTRSERNPFLSASLAAGAAFSRIMFDNPALEEVSVAKPMFIPSMGIGLASRHFRIVAGARFLLILFDNNPFTGLSPEIKVEYAF